MIVYLAQMSSCLVRGKCSLEVTTPRVYHMVCKRTLAALILHKHDIDQLLYSSPFAFIISMQST